MFPTFIKSRVLLLVFYFVVTGSVVFYFNSRINPATPLEKGKGVKGKLLPPLIRKKNKEKMVNETEEEEEVTDTSLFLFEDLLKPNVMVSEAERSKLTIKDLAVVTFTSSNHISEAVFVRI